MRVLHVDSGKYWRGSQKQIWLLSREERRKGIDSWVIARPNSPLLKRCIEIGIPTTEVKVRIEIPMNDKNSSTHSLRLYIAALSAIIIHTTILFVKRRFGGKKDV